MWIRPVFNTDATRSENLRKWQAFQRGTSTCSARPIQPSRTSALSVIQDTTDAQRSASIGPAVASSPQVGKNTDVICVIDDASVEGTSHPFVAIADTVSQRNTAGTCSVARQLSEVSGRVEAEREKQRCRSPKGVTPHSLGTSWFGRKTAGKRDRETSRDGSTTKSNKRVSVDKKRPSRVGPSGPEGNASSLQNSRAKATGTKRAQAKSKSGKLTSSSHHARNSADDTSDSRAARTVFYLQPPATSADGPVHIPYEMLDDTRALFRDITLSLNDPDRIQAPPLYVGLLLTENDKTTVSQSALLQGKAHFLPHVQPQKAHLYVRAVVLRWNDNVYSISGVEGLAFLLRVLMELPGVEIITFHAPAVLLPVFALAEGRLWTHCVTDVQLMVWMLNPAETSENINDYATLLQQHMAKEDVSLDTNDTLQTLCNQVYYLAPLYRSLYGQLGAKGLLQPFLRQEKRITMLIVSMKWNGFVVDVNEVHRFKKRCENEMDALRAQAQSLVPEMVDFNIQSHDHCRKAIYEVLCLGKLLLDDNGVTASGVAITKGGKLSTAEETLKVLAQHHKFPRVLIAYRKAAKLLQTYVEGMMDFAVPCSYNASTGELEPLTEGEHTDPSCHSEPDVFTDAALDGTSGHRERDECTTTPGETLKRYSYAKLYPNFLQTGTDTGRLSCAVPNLQNLPRRAFTDRTADEGDGVLQNEFYFRRCFVAPPGFVLLSVDYQQIELRVLAHLCGDPALVTAMTNTTDIHRSIAEAVFRKSPVSSEERSLAKGVVFGTLYGAGPRTLAAQAGTTVEYAAQVASLLKMAYPRIDAYQKHVVEQCRKEGQVRTLSGRIRHLPDIASSVIVKRSYAERQAFNTVVQGSAADIMKLAMLAVEKDVLHVYGTDVRLLVQLHDEVVLAVRKGKLREVVPLIVATMSHAMPLIVPLCVTAKVGMTFADLEEWTVDHDLGVATVE